MTTAPLLLLAALVVLAIIVALGVWLVRTRRREHRAVYQRQLESAVADGVLTPEEMRQLEQLRTQGALSDAEVRMAALAVYRRALADAMADSRITADEEQTLARMQSLLGLRDADLSADADHLRRMRLLAQLEAGRLPSVDAPIELATGESAHWTVQATVCERMGLGGRTAEPDHITFEVGGGEPFSAARPRQPLGPSPHIMPVDLGVLAITGRASRFRGAKSDVIIDHARLRRVALYQDAIRLDVVEPTGSRYFLVSDPELTAAVLLLAAHPAQRRVAR